MSKFHLPDIKAIFKRESVAVEFWQPNPERDWLRVVYLIGLALLMILVLNYLLLMSLDENVDFRNAGDTKLNTSNLEEGIANFTKRQAILERYIKVPPEVVDPL